MTAKLVPYVVFMPEGFDNSHCKSSGCNNNGCEFSGNYCPLANAKKAVYSGYADSLGAHMIATPKGKAVTLWATELEEKK